MSGAQMTSGTISVIVMRQKTLVLDQATFKDDDEPKSNAGLELNGTMCDYEIICEDKKFSCHKAVLAANSKVFEVSCAPFIPEIIWVKNVRAVAVCGFLMKSLKNHILKI